MDKISIPLWKNTAKSTGRDFLVGKIKFLGLKVMVFENTKKERPSQPDFSLVITRDDYNGKQEENNNNSNSFFNGTMNHQDDDEMPF